MEAREMEATETAPTGTPPMRTNRAMATDIGEDNEISTEVDREPHEVYRGEAHPRRGQVSPGDDARAAACLQPHLHRLRPHPRIQVHDQRDADRGAVPCGGG